MRKSNLKKEKNMTGRHIKIVDSKGTEYIAIPARGQNNILKAVDRQLKRYGLGIQYGKTNKYSETFINVTPVRTPLREAS